MLLGHHVNPPRKTRTLRSFWIARLQEQPFVYHGMQLQHVMRLIREVCAVRHLSINTESTSTHWIARYGSFLKDPKLKVLTSARWRPF